MVGWCRVKFFFHAALSELLVSEHTAEELVSAALISELERATKFAVAAL